MVRALLVAVAIVCPALADAQSLPAGRRARASIPIVAGDTTPPTGSISTPATDPFGAGSTTPQTVSGTASDAVGVTSVTFTNSASSGGSCTGTTSWSCSVSLVSGSQIISITACDAAKNCPVIDTVTITYAPSASLFCSHCEFQSSFLDTDTGTTGTGWTANVTQGSGGTGFNGKQNGLGAAGGNTCDPGAVEDKVHTDSNNAAGRGGRGFGHCSGNTDTGIGVDNGGGIKLNTAAFTISGLDEVWFQFCVMWPVSWTWQAQGGGPTDSPFNMKIVYIDVNTTPFRIIEFGSGGFIMHISSNGSQPAGVNVAANLHSGGTFTWTEAMGNGNGTGDGIWHRVETRMKVDTNGTNGELDMWWDGTQTHSYTNINWGGAAETFADYLIGSNLRYAGNASPPGFYFFDDIYLSSTQRINIAAC